MSGAHTVDRPSSTVRDWIRYERRRIRDRQSSALATTAAAGPVYAVTELFMLAKWRLLGLPAPGSMFTTDRFELLDVAVDSAPSSGLWLEFGVWRGESINHIAERSGRPVVGFDSFEGLPRFWKPFAPVGSFSISGSLPEVRDGVSLVRGWFDQTLPAFLRTRPEDHVAFLHVDCDLYSSTRTVLTGLGRRITEGTVIVFDEFCGLMPDDEARAWREFCRKEKIAFTWLGCSLTGSVALKVTSRAQTVGSGSTVSS